MNSRKIWVNAQDVVAGDVLVAIDRGTHTASIALKFVVRKVAAEGDRVRIYSMDAMSKTAYPTNRVQVWRAY